MRKRDKQRIVKMFLRGMTAGEIAEEIADLTSLGVQGIIREALIAKEKREAKR